MQNFIKNKGITLVSLVVTIVVLIILAGVSISATLGENGIITMAKKAKQNIEIAQTEEEKELNELYVQMGNESGLTGGISYDAIAKLTEFKKTIATAITNRGIETKETDSAQTMADNIKKIKTNTEGTATSENILSGKTAWVNGNKITGNMINNSAKTINLNAGASYTIPKGYHNGLGKVAANSLSSQTVANATNTDILSGKTAWVNGKLITGTNEGGVLAHALDKKTIPQGVKKAYLIAAHLTSYNNNKVNISGDIVKSANVMNIATAAEAGVAAAVAEIIEIHLTGNSGTISVTFTGGSGSILKDDYILLYMK